MLDFNVSDRLTITLKGRIDTSNAASVEADIMKILADNPGLPVTVDCAALEYISSAGLRVIMKTKKAVRDTCLINVAPPVYEIFETTGFTELMDIRKALRTISVEGCDIIGKGAKGTVYRIDKETIVKTFKDGSDISDIERERKLARTAFVLGIPTAISYDVVKIQGGGYGSVYELLDASNLADELASGRKTMDEVVQLEVELLKTIHSTEVNPDQIPPFTEKAMKWLEYDKDHLPADKYEKLCSLVQSIPDDNHLIHGDFHMKNIMYQNGECLLIDMDSLSHGNTVYELVTIWCSYVGLGEIDNTIVENFLGISYQDAVKIWKMTVASFFETDDQAKIKE
ncbi:MAG: STAS domain-containing protein, partial [Spirochaetales bacterium]|nr:STAS domain-containing protein [Spirochaetales bacterium]